MCVPLRESTFNKRSESGRRPQVCQTKSSKPPGDNRSSRTAASALATAERTFAPFRTMPASVNAAAISTSPHRATFS